MLNQTVKEMPVYQSNPLTQGLQGMLGHTVVFRMLHGRTVISSRPKKRRRMTAHQKLSKENFQRAVLYAKAQMKIPAAKAEYACRVDDKLTNAYTVALVDCLKGPEIFQVDVAGYAGRVGDEIVIHARDNFRVEAVSVEIRSADNDLLDSGMALHDHHTYTKWTFRSLKPISLAANTRVVIRAEDKPRNITVKEVVLGAGGSSFPGPPEGDARGILNKPGQSGLPGDRFPGSPYVEKQ